MERDDGGGGDLGTWPDRSVRRSGSYGARVEARDTARPEFREVVPNPIVAVVAQVSAVPHSWQKRASASLGVLHCAQCLIPSGEPHWWQNCPVDKFAARQPGQAT
jgi:hypothetical protein